MTLTVGALVLLGMVLVVPLGLRLLATPGFPLLRRLWPAAGAVAGVSLLLPVGGTAAALTLPYLLLATAAAVLAVHRAVVERRHVRRAGDAARELAALTAGGSLLVAAVSLTSERVGYALLGFDGEVLALTVAHFHYAGFAVALLAGLVLVRAPGWLAMLGAAAVPAGTVLVAAGHFLGRGTELLGALVLTAGLLAASLATVLHVLPARGPARWLLLASACTTPLTMALALWWAVGRLTGLAHPDLALMAVTHGVGNAVGVCLCGLLGWRLLRPAPV